MTEHNNTRLRLDVRFRELTVLRTEEVTPHMRRVVLGGDELAGFDSPGADDHIKLFFPNASGEMVLPVVTAEGAAIRPARSRRRPATTPRAGGTTRPASWPSTSYCTTRALPGRGPSRPSRATCW